MARKSRKRRTCKSRKRKPMRTKQSKRHSRQRGGFGFGLKAFLTRQRNSKRNAAKVANALGTVMSVLGSVSKGLKRR